jgi:hypothetical protein
MDTIDGDIMVTDDSSIRFLDGIESSALERRLDRQVMEGSMKSKDLSIFLSDMH